MDDMVSGAGGWLWFWSKEGRGDSRASTRLHSRPVNKVPEDDAHRRCCDVTFYSRRHDAASSAQSDVCFSWRLMSWISHRAPLKTVWALMLEYGQTESLQTAWNVQEEMFSHWDRKRFQEYVCGFCPWGYEVILYEVLPRCAVRLNAEQRFHKDMEKKKTPRATDYCIGAG